ncbi:hypothetical protein VP01_486g4 [Puccinia sorghi]|uniref:PITH domain-containing protein n=1 Tax=Puccinia sorghi TaxID=27349 RepID=A0A0L6UM94_9BASI|nr:hypothetical protein VP01_486g4 [Puccinia sorghi]
MVSQEADALLTGLGPCKRRPLSGTAQSLALSKRGSCLMSGLCLQPQADLLHKRLSCSDNGRYAGLDGGLTGDSPGRIGNDSGGWPTTNTHAARTKHTTRTTSISSLAKGTKISCSPRCALVIAQSGSIALDQVTGCNIEPSRPAKACIKAWDHRMDDSQFTESDMDQQLIIQIPFTGSVKLRTVMIRTLPGQFRPTHAHLFANEPSLDFDALESRKPTQILEIPETTEVVEFPVRVAKFSSVTSLSIFFNSTASGAEKSQVNFLGFKGEFTNVRDSSDCFFQFCPANPSLPSTKPKPTHPTTRKSTAWMIPFTVQFSHFARKHLRDTTCHKVRETKQSIQSQMTASQFPGFLLQDIIFVIPLLPHSTREVIHIM